MDSKQVIVEKTTQPTTSQREPISKRAQHSADTTSAFTPLSRDEYVKYSYGSNKYWFMKHYGLKWNNEADMREADAMIDMMRNDESFYSEEMLKRLKASKFASENQESTTGSADSMPATSLSQSCIGMPQSHRSEEEFCADAVIVETPAQARAIHEDGTVGGYNTPSRLSTVYEEVGIPGGGVLLPETNENQGGVVPSHSDSDDDVNYDEDSDDDEVGGYHNAMGCESGIPRYYNDFAGEYDAGYNDY